MSTTKQIDTSRRTAQKSTGPRSAEGKAASRANSFKSGLYCRCYREDPRRHPHNRLFLKRRRELRLTRGELIEGSPVGAR
jgi:hypothetical protein